VSLNWKEINLILSELNLKNKIIREIYQPDYQTLILELYQKGEKIFVLISLSNPYCRIHSVKAREKNRKKLLRFIPFLRAHIRGGRITDAFQVGNERIIKLNIVRAGEEVIIWIRLWASSANIIVTDKEGCIMDAFYRRPKRGEISGGVYYPEKSLKEIKKDREYRVREIEGDGSFNERIELYYSRLEAEKKREQIKKKLLRLYETKENNLLSVLEKLNLKRRNREQIKRYKEIGDLILSNLHRISKGDKWLKADDFYNPGRIIEIELDELLTPGENADKYYKKYSKEKQLQDRIESDLTLVQKELEDTRSNLELIKNPDTGLAAMERLKPLKSIQRKPDKKQGIPGQYFISFGFKIIVGKKSQENDILLRRYMKGNDYWFHVRDCPGAYVFVKMHKNKTISLETMLDAANLAVFYSKAETSREGNVYYTRVKYLRRLKKGKIGLVIPMQEKNLYIKLDFNRLERLQNSKELY
jgi:predicted ribosome quality control (RQC) complex YloA/Tae2 family protein